MTRRGDGDTLGRRSFLGALGAAAGGAGFATTAAGLEAAPRTSGAPPLEVGIEPKVGAFDSYRRGLIPVGVRLPEAVDRDDLETPSLRFGPPRVVEASGGARPERVEQDALVFHFSASKAGFEFGDTGARLVGRTEAGREIVGETGLPPGHRGPGGILNRLL